MTIVARQNRERDTNFNSHAHVERDRLANNKIVCLKNFNSHAHVERDLNWYILIIQLTISTHTLTWSVTVPLQKNTGWLDDFNSHAHVERDIFAGKIYINIVISTHTLTWSVTLEVSVVSLDFFISTHTLTWSVT